MDNPLFLIKQERYRQVVVKGYSRANDDTCKNGELAQAAAAYASAELYRRVINDNHDTTPNIWPFDKTHFKPTPEDRIKELAKAGALIVAEIERLQNLS
jgi:hypothetical protein